MALDRQSIEKKDFPIARRGYDPEAVDAHLEQLAVEIEGLQRQASSSSRSPVAAAPVPAPARATPASIAIAASDHVRAIVEAAESSAAEIEAGAREEAARIVREAEDNAADIRDDAVAKSQDHVGAVAESTSGMLQRVDAMEGELGALMESLRTGANRLGADLSLLKGNMGELYDVAGAAAPAAAPAPIESMPLAKRRPEPTAGAADVPDRALPPIPEEAPDPSPHAEAPIVPPGLFTATEPVPAAKERTGSVLDEPYPEASIVPAVEEAPAFEPAPPAAEPAPAPTHDEGAGDGDIDGARLIALNMALNGASREETDAYLRDNFDLPDRGALVDEAYATVEG
ncbi:hypothetical protein DSM112329_03180 [Paraconexibacter sp. AEG42_29]|uniref:Cell wall synthesis protein Wag31 n=1 Tax=Paraconexibacter sp. AEG42_29 TaxID=2997339 RepID=A0AAU7AXF7_9ACTN